MVNKEVSEEPQLYLCEIVWLVLVKVPLIHHGELAVLQVILNTDRYVHQVAMVGVQGAHVCVWCWGVHMHLRHLPFAEDTVHSGWSCLAGLNDPVVLCYDDRLLHRHNRPLVFPACLIDEPGDKGHLIIGKPRFKDVLIGPGLLPGDPPVFSSHAV